MCFLCPTCSFFRGSMIHHLLPSILPDAFKSAFHPFLSASPSCGLPMRDSEAPLGPSFVSLGGAASGVAAFLAPNPADAILNTTLEGGALSPLLLEYLGLCRYAINRLRYGGLID